MSDFDEDDYNEPDYGDEEDDMMGGFDMHDDSSLPEGVTKEVLSS